MCHISWSEIEYLLAFLHSGKSSLIAQECWSKVEHDWSKTDQMMVSQMSLSIDKENFLQLLVITNLPSGLRPDRRGRERFDDRKHSLHRTFWKIWTSKFRS